MSVVIDGTSGVTTPGVVNTAGETIATTLSVTGVTTLTGGLNAALPVLSGGTGVTTKTGTGAVVLGTSPTITGATITVASTAAPAFSAYATVGQVVSNATFTKVTFGAEDFDTNGNFASSTFTPTVAGYYQFNCQLNTIGGSTQTRYLLNIYKNGSNFSRLLDASISFTAGQQFLATGSILLYANGTTDYFEVYGYMSGTGTLQFSSTGSTETARFSASMVRSA